MEIPFNSWTQNNSRGEIPPIIIDEKQRYAALQRYGVLDSPASAVFDCITTAASAACDAPMALITLLDTKRQWFLSRVGLELTETPRDISFCTHAIKKPKELTEIADMEKDQRFRNNPFVVGDLKVRFYAGKPLCTPDGYALGTLCVMGNKPKSLTPIQRDTLEHMANLVMLLLEDRISSPISVIGRAVEENLPNGVVMTNARDPDNPITFCNKGFEDLTGYTLPEILGKNCRFLQGASTDPDKVAMIQRAVKNKEAFTTVIKNYRKDGSDFWNELTLSPVADGAGELSCYLGFQYDVTARIKAQEALESSHEGLRKSVDLHSEVSDKLASANAALQKEMTQRISTELQSLKLQNDLLHTGRLTTMGEMATGLAHELNQPLLAISQSADTAILVAKENNDCDAELLECLNDIQLQTQRAGEIIRALRQFISRDASNRCEVDINELARQSVRLIKSDARALNIKINVVEGVFPQPLADRVQIAQVLVNLLRNSVDAISGLPNSRLKAIAHIVTVETSFKGGCVQVSVTDTGPGFESGVEPFKAFETSKKSGLGIGLSISQSIVQSHHGELLLDEGFIDGCRMIFTLPLESSTTGINH